MKTFITTLSAIALAFSPILNASESGARREADEICRLMRDVLDLKVRDNYQSGYLSEGDCITIRTTLTAGLSYTIVAGGDEGALDVDVSVYDESGNLIDRDGDSSDRAVAHVHPRWTGTFRIVIKMARTSGYGARYVLQTGFERA